MSLRTQNLYFVTCDSCQTEHHDPDAASALEARVKAGVAGWTFRAAAPGRSKEKRRAADACPNCKLVEVWP